MAPNIPTSFFLRGKSYEAEGDVENAIHFYTRFLEGMPNAEGDYVTLTSDARASLDRLLLANTREPQ